MFISLKKRNTPKCTLRLCTLIESIQTFRGEVRRCLHRVVTWVSQQCKVIILSSRGISVLKTSNIYSVKSDPYNCINQDFTNSSLKQLIYCKRKTNLFESEEINNNKKSLMCHSQETSVILARKIGGVSRFLEELSCMLIQDKRNLI